MIGMAITTLIDSVFVRTTRRWRGLDGVITFHHQVATHDDDAIFFAVGDDDYFAEMPRKAIISLSVSTAQFRRDSGRFDADAYLKLLGHAGSAYFSTAAEAARYLPLFA